LPTATFPFNADEEIGPPSSRPAIGQTALGYDASLVVEGCVDGALKTRREGIGIFTRTRPFTTFIHPVIGRNRRTWRPWLRVDESLGVSDEVFEKAARRGKVISRFPKNLANPRSIVDGTDSEPIDHPNRLLLVDAVLLIQSEEDLVEAGY
jgi:hypothetical protein